MAYEELTTEETLSVVAYAPQRDDDEVITLRESECPSYSDIRPHLVSSIGRLDCLPLEILHNILDFLDLRSLAHFSQVSVRGHDNVKSSLAFDQLRQAAGYTFRILSRTKAIGLHSVTTLRNALYSNRCTTCGDYGPLLLLESALRCCYTCLASTRDASVLGSALSDDVHGITIADCIDVYFCPPTFVTHDTPANSLAPRPSEWDTFHKAERLARMIHRSLREHCHRAISEHMVFGGRSISMPALSLNAQWRPLVRNPIAIARQNHMQTDQHVRRFCMAFPSVSEAGIEHGLSCRGCLASSQTSTVNIKRLIRIRSREILVVWRRPQDYIYSVAEMLEHIKHCREAQVRLNDFRKQAEDS